MNEHEFTAILETLQSQQDLSPQQMRDTIGWLLSGQADESVMRQLLVAMADKGESVGELVGAAQAMRDSMNRIRADYDVIADTCGTGGDGSKTFNISTAAAIVTAGAGVPVAKHGNRKVTSSTGSADVLSELGINLEAPPAVAEKCLREIGLCFCFAPFFHPAMKHVGPVRQSIDRPTVFNRLGPLANPASANCQVLGVGDAALQDRMAQALQQLGTRRSVVVRGVDGVDEISLSAPTRVLEVTTERIVEHEWSPADFGVPIADRSELFADSPTSSADCIRDLLSGSAGPRRDVVVINAAAALWLADAADSLSAAAELARAAIDEGKAQQVVEALSDLTSTS